MKILPCPFCGCGQCEVKIVRYPGTFLSWVECLMCGARGPVGFECVDDYVIERWNSRKFLFYPITRIMLNGEIAEENMDSVNKSTK